jgi:hypothetical protein
VIIHLVNIVRDSVLGVRIIFVKVVIVEFFNNAKDARFTSARLVLHCLGEITNVQNVSLISLRRN